MADKLKFRRDTSENWENVNPILAQGEPGFDLEAKKLKIGDGVNTWDSIKAHFKSFIENPSDGDILKDGQIGIDNIKNIIKIGDGITQWKALEHYRTVHDDWLIKYYGNPEAHSAFSFNLIGFGDSNTENRYDLSQGLLDPYQNYVAFFKYYWAHEPTMSYVNGYTYGYPGETSTEALTHYNEIPKQPKSFVVLNWGTNDVSQDVSVDTYISNMETLINNFLSDGMLPIIMLIPHRTDSSTKADTTKIFNNLLIKLAESYHLPIIDIYTPTKQDPNNYLKTDNIHLSVLGYQYIATKLIEIVKHHQRYSRPCKVYSAYDMLSNGAITFGSAPNIELYGFTTNSSTNFYLPVLQLTAGNYIELLQGTYDKRMQSLYHCTTINASSLTVTYYNDATENINIEVDVNTEPQTPNLAYLIDAANTWKNPIKRIDVNSGILELTTIKIGID